MKRLAPFVVGGALVLMLVLALARPTPEAPMAPASPLLSHERSAELEQRAAQRRAEGHAPRTRHLDADGHPLHTNRLVETRSPYLQQHAHNPVQWFPWGPEAFAMAEKLDRPILLSIGYATCHWCHVMEEESFEDPEIAALINAHFVPIKVDRETRPDIDRIYMTAVNLSMGRGGWPATLVLRPDQSPFFAATYIPPRDGDRGREKGFLTILGQLADDWTKNRAQIDGFAVRLAEAVRKDLERPGGTTMPGSEAVAGLLAGAEERYDPVEGGTRRAPKFPSTLPLRNLLASGKPEHRKMALHTLDKMAAGGMYDHLGGGFHRYSTDARWQIPHFEKMLYDNALLARAYGEAFQLTGDLRYARVVVETVEFLIRDLGADGGGFCSALDADSKRPDGEVEEGWFYSWTPAELRQILGPESAAFEAAYAITARGNFEGRNVLHFPQPPDLETRDRFRAARLKLELERRKRPSPLRDDKVLTSWNGLAIDALAYNGWLLGREDWLEEARDAADLLLEARVEGRLQRVVHDEGGEGTAFLDDHAFLVKGLITLFEATGERRWLDEAVTLTQIAEQHHGSDGAWFRTPADHEALLTRDKPTHDQAIPSGNSVFVANLLRLAALTGDDAHRQRAEAIATALPIAKQPIGFPHAVLALQGQPQKEIVLVTAAGERSSGLHAALKSLHPAKRVFIQQTEGEPAVVPLTEGKLRLGAPTVYVCQGGVCDRPLTDPAAVAALLAR